MDNIRKIFVNPLKMQKLGSLRKATSLSSVTKLKALNTVVNQAFKIFLLELAPRETYHYGYMTKKK